MYEIVSRDEKNTAVKITNGEKTETRTFLNEHADLLKDNTLYEQVEAKTDKEVVVEAEIEEAPVAETVETEAPVSKETPVVEKAPEAEVLSEFLHSDEGGIIRFAQHDIDYSDNTMRESKFYISIGNDETSGRKEVEGYVVGKYGVRQNEKGTFTVSHLQSGLRMATAETLEEAQQMAKYLNENVAFNDISYSMVKGKGYMPGATNSFTAEVKRIVAEKPYLVEDAEAAEDEVQTEEIKYPHLYDEDKVSQEFIDAVNEDIEAAIINIRKGNLDAVPEVIEVVELDESSINTLSDFLGYDISGYTVKIERDRLMHIERRHGINGKHDHSLSDPKDTARMGYVLNHGDDIDWVVDDNGNKVFDTQYNDKNNKPSPVIMISSKVDGTYCVSQAAPESRKKTLWITSARIQKADVGSQVPNSSNATPQLQTSETPLDSSSASDNSISNDSEIVNSDGLTSKETNATIKEGAVSENVEEQTASDSELPKSITYNGVELVLSETKDTRDDSPLYIMRPTEHIAPETFKSIREDIKAHGGFYSRYFTAFAFSDKDKYVDFINSAEETVTVVTSKDDGLTSEETSAIIKDSDKEATIYTTDNEPVKVIYRVVSVDELIASNDADGTVNKNYPQELQPRDRTREASQRQIREMANNIQPERLGESANVSDGAPIIGSDMVVESGNGRVLAIREMYRLGKGNSYIDYIKKNADKFGIDLNNIPEKPVLVRERISEVDREKFVKKANESGLSSMSATEKAKLDAEKLTSDILDLFVPNKDGSINTVDNRNFIKAVIDGVFESNELNSVVDANGNLSAVGLERITNAIFYKAYGDDSLAARLAESLDNDIKNVTKVLLNVAPRVAKIKSDIKSGNLYDIDFSEDIVGAANLFSYLKDSGMKLEAYLSQVNLFDDYSDIAIEIANVFEQKNRGAKQATEFLNIVLDMIEATGNPNQISLMSTKILTKEEIIHNAISEFNGRDEARADIALANKREQVDGRGTQAVSDAETAHEGNRPGEKSEVESRDRSSGQKNSGGKRIEEIKIAVGDVFVSNSDEKTYRIIERTNDTTSVEVTSGDKKDVLTMSNATADEVFIDNDGLTKVVSKKEKTAGETKSDKSTPKKTTKPKSVETTVKIEDFGEKIGGARKDLWSSRGLVTDDLEGMNEREREKNVKKDNVWKRPNYRSLVEAGGDRGLLWAVNEIRKSLVQNIYYGYKATAETKAEKQKAFIETIREIQTMAESAKTKQDFEDMGEKWLIDNEYLVEYETGYHGYSYTRKYSENPALSGGKYLETIRYIVKNFDNLTKFADRDQFAIDAKSKVPKGFSIVGGKDSVGSKLVNGEWVKDETYSVVKGRIIVQSGFETREAALEWLNKTVAKKKGKTRFIPKQLLEVHRKGPDYRGGKSVDGQNYIDTFGFKGGEFGNWMSTKDRQVSLDYGFDALKDLADALGIEDTDISFGGNLSIAFGARGQGLSGAAAHYESLRRVINLTKMNGAGSLAHEWFHALDDFIGGYTDNYATNNQRTLPENTKTAIRNLITAMRYRDATQEETDLAQQHRYERAVKRVTYQLETLFKWVKKVEDGTLTDYDVQRFKRKPTKEDAEKYRRLYNSLIETGDKAYIKELSKLRKEVYGHVISADDTVDLEMCLLPLTPEAKNNVQLTRKATDFYNNSQRFGQIHSKDGDYWDSTIEMAARAFACYVADKTHKQNDYLSAHSDNAVTLDMDKDENPVVVRAFPVGEERIIINSAFDDLFAALKADGFLHEREQTEKPSEISYSLEKEEDAGYALESEDNYGETGDLLHNGSEQRRDGKRSRKQVAGVVKAAEKGSETAEERKSFTEGLTAEQLVEKILTDGDGNRHKYVEIKKEAWNQSMNDIADFYAKKGVNVHFLKGNVEIAFAGKDRAARAMRVGNDIYVSYDHATFTPEQLAMHEYVHIQYQSEEVQSAKKAIFDKMSVEEKRALIDKIKEAYGDAVTDGKLEEEAVCNILSGMYRSARHKDVVNSFWSTETDAIDNFKVAEYTESTDAGGEKSYVKDGEENVSEDSQTLGNERPGENNDSVWERSADTEGIYTRLGNREMVLRRGEEGRRGFVDWSGKIQSDSNPTRKTKRTAGILREISKRRIADSDAQGRPLSEHVKQYFAETVAKDAEGRLIPLYHATPADFTEFALGDFAFHIGTLEQAMHFGHKYIKEVYINVKNPMYIDGDTMRWPGLVIANKAVEQGIFSEKEYEFVSKLEGFRGNDYNAPANVIIREVLESKGYDGIVYNNDFEGNGISFIVFNSNQIKYASNQNPTADKRINYSLDTDGEADLDDLIAEYGEIEPGENPVREVHVPKKISENRFVSHFARTMMEAGGR